MHLHLQGVSFAFADAAPIIDDATLSLSSGWSGLVGPNGAGKTTLLRLLNAELALTRGHIRRAPEDLRVLLCAQELVEPTPELLELAHSNERRAHRVRAALRLSSMEAWCVLSPGERKRWQIGAALFAEPDVLLLDEPTNHLDREARAQLLDALRLHRGIGVIVSHDRALLDRLTTQTLQLSAARLHAYAGAYSAALAQVERQDAQRRRAREEARADVRAIAARVQSARVAQRGAAAQKHASQRMRNRNDSDARSILARTKADWADSAHGRKVEVLNRTLARAEAELAAQRVTKPLGNAVFAGFAPAPSATIGFVERGELRAGERSLLELPALTLHRDDRVWIAGPNGAGKSTFLKLLAASLRLAREDVVELAQELAPSAAEALLRGLRELEPQLRAQVLTIVAGLGVDPERLLISQQPSPGEARKLLLALGFARRARALILDEPENHLDVPSIERLEAALREYPGALYLVTHDERLALNCTRQRWSLGEGFRIEEVS